MTTLFELAVIGLNSRTDFYIILQAALAQLGLVSRFESRVTIRANAELRQVASRSKIKPSRLG